MNRIFIEKLKLIESYRVPFLGKYWYRFFSKIDQKLMEREKIINPLNTEKRDEIVICSLTSFPARIEYVHLAIKSLMCQTYKPDRITLWLAEEQFPNKILPTSLTDLQQYGLEILWCHDLYGHKKYYYGIKHQQPNEVIITFDDDIIYSPICVERLMISHKKHPKAMVCERAQALIEGVKNPGMWQTISSKGVKTPSYSLNPSPGGGCLIPYNAFNTDATNEALIRRFAYKNDDLWYMFMCAENKTRIVKTRKHHRIFTVINGSQTVQMATDNVVGNKNIEIMEGLIKAYPNAWRRILTDKD